ncbi:MAG: GntR family transcriptional regulator [Clostridiales bacterium]|nr:GntR family transcriptional regulator [Clostridiales bacterium]
MLNRARGAAPLYSQIADILKGKIENGEFASGDLFYTEKLLQEMFQVSRITVRQAISELEAEGYVQSSRGVGTMVTYGKIDENLKNLVSFTDEMKRHGKEMTTSYCEMSLVKAEKTTAAQLEILPGEDCYRLTRVRSVNDEPIVYSVTFLKKVREYPLDIHWYMKSLYGFLQTEYGIKVVKGRDTLEAVLATPEMSKYLSVPVDSPIFKRVRKTYDENGEIVEYSLCYYPGARYKYSVEL